MPLPDAEGFQSKILHRGCYIGTQNQAYVLLREDHSFEVHATGVFFYSRWYTGYWHRQADTIVLNYDQKEPHRLLTNKVVIQNNYLKPVIALKDTSGYKLPMFYLGYCKD